MARTHRSAAALASVVLVVLAPVLARPGPAAGSELTLPVPAPVGPVVATVGDEVVVFGGTRDGVPRNDGVAFHPGSGRWRLLPVAPLDPALSQPSGVGVGDTLVVAGTRCAGRRGGVDVASCRPGGPAFALYSRGVWRTVPTPPGTGAGEIATVLGRRGDAAVVRVGAARLWLLDPRRAGWRALPDPPLRDRLCVRDGRVVATGAVRPVTPVAGGTAPADPPSLHTASLPPDAGAWSATWSAAPAPTDCPAGPPALALTRGRRLVVDADALTGTVRLTLRPRSAAVVPARPAAADAELSGLVRAVDGRAAARPGAGRTAWFHVFNLAGNVLNEGRRAPADAVVFVVAAARARPVAIALNEVCVDWADPGSQLRRIVAGLAPYGYSALVNVVQHRPDRTSCPSFGNVLLHLGTSQAYPRSFQFWYSAQARQDTDTGEWRGGVCARVDATWSLLACSSHLTSSGDRADDSSTQRFHQSAAYESLAGPWQGTAPDLDPTLPSVRGGDLNAAPDSVEQLPWVRVGSPWVDGDGGRNRATFDGGGKIDYLYASGTTGVTAAEVSGDLVQSDHRYTCAVFVFAR